VSIRPTSGTDHRAVRRVTEVLAAARLPGRVLLLVRPAPSAAAERRLRCGGHRELPGLRRRRSDSIRTLVDTWPARHPQARAAAGHPHTVFSTTYAELLELTGGRAVDVER